MPLYSVAFWTGSALRRIERITADTPEQAFESAKLMLFRLGYAEEKTRLTVKALNGRDTILVDRFGDGRPAPVPSNHIANPRRRRR